MFHKEAWQKLNKAYCVRQSASGTRDYSGTECLNVTHNGLLCNSESMHKESTELYGILNI